MGKMIIVTLILFVILSVVCSFYIGYIKGFNESKKIDDKIIKELFERRKNK